MSDAIEPTLPNREEAHIDRRKLTEYLPNRNQPDAKGKSAFFCGRYGTDWRQLREDLLEHAAGPGTHVEETRHGTTYVVEGRLSDALVRSVWIVRTGEFFPRLVTHSQISQLRGRVRTHSAAGPLRRARACR